MGSQGFRNIAGNPFVYQEDVRSAAFGLDAAAQTWKVSIKATTGALPTDTAQLIIDPAANGNVTIDPNGSGNLVVNSGNVNVSSGNLNLTSGNANLTSGNVNLTAGNLNLPSCTSSVGQITTNSHRLLFPFVAAGGDTSYPNLFLGYDAGNFTMTSTAAGNMAFGTRAGAALTSGINNCLWGQDSGAGLTSGRGNLCIGSTSLFSATTTYNSIALGALTLYLSTGNENVGIAPRSLRYLTSGSMNVAIGFSPNIATGSEHFGSGDQYTSSESGNFLINSAGVTGESNKLRIGSGTGSGTSQFNAAYISGIYGVTPSGTKNIALIDSNNQLGSIASLTPAYGGRIAWTEVTGTSQAGAVNNGYITNNAALVTVTLPATAAVGDIVRIGGKGAGLWKLAQNSGQTIHFGSIDTTTGAGGYLAATVRYDAVEVICITANTDWVVISSVGSITIV